MHATNPTTPRVSAGHRNLLLTAAAATWLLVTMGGVVCFTGSTYGCPDWPGCFGSVVPPAEAASIIEWTHRVSVLLAAPLVLAAAVLGWRRRAGWWVSRAPALALALFAVVAALGALTVVTGIPRWLAVVDLTSALLALALVVAAAVAAVARQGGAAMATGAEPGMPGVPGVKSADAPTAVRGLARAVAAGALLVLVGGIVAAEPGSIVRCLGWPLLDAASLDAAGRSWLALERYGLAAASAAGMLALPVVVRAARPVRPGLASLATLPALLVVGLAVVSVWLGGRTFGVGAAVAYVAMTSALWVTLVALVAATTPGVGSLHGRLVLGLAGEEPNEDAHHHQEANQR